MSIEALETRATPDGSMRIGRQQLFDFASAALTACGMSISDAASVADVMVEADLIGADAHGTFRLEQYVGALKAGDINPVAQLSIRKERSAVGTVDGGGGMGHLAMLRAAGLADDLATASGVGWVGIRRSNHAGAIGIYAARLASKGMIGICGAVSGVNHMAPSGSAEALLGTNPLAIAIPGGRTQPIVVDIATSVTSYGKIKAAAAEGSPLPIGWAIDRQSGEALTDSSEIASGLLLALGGYKGSGLALALGILGGVLNSASFGRAIPDFASTSSASVNTGQFVIAIDVNAFRPLLGFIQEVDDHVDAFMASDRLPGHDTVRLPGQERSLRRNDRMNSGIPMSASRLRILAQLARRLAIAPLKTTG